MRIKALLAAVVISGALVGCGTVPTVPTDPKLIVGRAPPAATFLNTVKCPLPDGDCTVKIEVIGDCQFKVPDLVILSGVAGRRHAVVWRIMSNEYAFPRTGNALDPKLNGNFFGSPGVFGNFMGVEVTVTTPGMSHEYGLNMVKRNGTVCSEVDPYLIE